MDRFNHNPIQHTIDVIYSTYGHKVSVDLKKKDLLKFGRRTTVGTDWETVMSTVGTELEETLVGDNLIAFFSSDNALDAGVYLDIEGHIIDSSTGVVSFTTTTVQLDGADGTTPVELDDYLFRITRVSVNEELNAQALVGEVSFYQNVPQADAETHITIPAGEQQSQKGATFISSADYWIITEWSASCFAKTTKYAEARLEKKHYSNRYFYKPFTQSVSVTDTTGTVIVPTTPHLIVPADHDVRLVMKTNTSGVDVGGGIQGYLAKIIT